MNIITPKRDCPVDGLEIFEKPEWVNKNIGDGYYISLRKIGSNIISEQNSGDTKFFRTRVYYQYFKAFIEGAGVKKAGMYDCFPKLITPYPLGKVLEKW